jgi:IS30 family transposase
MPRKYHHLTLEQRCQIQTLKSRNYSQYGIANLLKISPATISRELQRNQDECGKYEFYLANNYATNRRRLASCRPRKITTDLIEKIEYFLQQKWSPEQISGRLKLSNIHISHEAIYQHIWRNREKGLILLLRRGGKRYHKRKNKYGSRITDRVDISNRPKVVETKSRIGDWEGDTIIGAKHQGAILTYVERKSKFTMLAKLDKKTANNVAKNTIKIFKQLPRKTYTITYDNGLEFANHTSITKNIGAKCYFATPYHSWERGLNGHTNGLIRQYFPKTKNLSLVSEHELKKVQNALNNCRGN